MTFQINIYLYEAQNRITELNEIERFAKQTEFCLPCENIPDKTWKFKRVAELINSLLMNRTTPVTNVSNHTYINKSNRFEILFKHPPRTEVRPESKHPKRNTRKPSNALPQPTQKTAQKKTM